MEFTVVIENTAPEELEKEWGLCIYIEYEGNKYLLDTGSTNKFLDNAKRLHIPIDEIDLAVLSHAHNDHSGGMPAFFEENEKADFLLRSSAGENCYIKKWMFRHYVGIKKGLLKQQEKRIRLITGDYEAEKGVWLIPHKTQGLWEKGKECSLYRKVGKRFVPDDFCHEQSLIFETKQGLVIFNSCSHAGADVIIREAQETFPGKYVYAIVGGFHLFGQPEQKVRGLAERMKKTGIQKVYTGHCTGSKAFCILKETFGEDAVYMETGLHIII